VSSSSVVIVHYYQHQVPPSLPCVGVRNRRTSWVEEFGKGTRSNEEDIDERDEDEDEVSEEDPSDFYLLNEVIILTECTFHLDGERRCNRRPTTKPNDRLFILSVTDTALAVYFLVPAKERWHMLSEEIVVMLQKKMRIPHYMYNRKTAVRISGNRSLTHGMLFLGPALREKPTASRQLSRTSF